MLVKLDENMAKTHVELLQQAGYDADRVTDEGLSGTDDEIVWQQVCSEGRFFITLDLDFSDVRRFPPGNHPGILLVRPSRHSRDIVSEILSRVLQGNPLETLKGCLVVADPIQNRIRRPSSISEPEE
ncbi:MULTISPECIES: DUF5615 family PIN-like protein [Nostocales]|nr:DUF5615 family PIN-like protein [Tolypothrix bouteillei]KAF3890975.1 DUF5615 family PIN-like protein [Tolypothrix bouteillei VB521301]